MAGDVMYAVEQSAQQRANLAYREPAIVGAWRIDPMGMAPFPIGGKNGSKARHVGAVMAETGRVGMGERLGDIQPDMTGIPLIGKTNVEQVGGKRELGDNAGSVKYLTAVIVVEAVLQSLIKGFRIVIAEAAEVSSRLGSNKGCR